MGLDQSAFRRDSEAEPETKGEILETWRKHPRLQGFMNELFIGKTGGHMKEYHKLEYIHHTLQEVISDSKKMGDHLIDTDMIEKSLRFVEDIREPFLSEENERMGDPGMNTPDELELTLTDINALEDAIKTHTLPDTGGFFWGEDSSEHYYKQDLEFCMKARKAIKEGDRVFYWCWW